MLDGATAAENELCAAVDREGKRMMPRRLLPHALSAFVAGAAALFSVGALAQQPAARAGDPAHDRLVQDAKKEGEVVVYSTAPPSDNKAIVDGFEALYHIPVKLWRSSSEEILQRAIAEAGAGRTQVDAVINTGVGLEAMHREKLLQPIETSASAGLLPEAIPAHHEWVGVYLAPMVQLYNTQKIRKEDLPKTWDDLLAPRWKDKLAIEAADYDWFQAVVENLGRDRGLALFRKMVAQNKVSVRKGHSLLANLVVAGEVPLALTVYQFTADQLHASGAPVASFVIPPAMTIQVGVGLSKAPVHPHAAMLFRDYLIHEAQDMLAKRDFVPARATLAAHVPFQMKVQDAASVLDHSREWENLYRQIFVMR
jgi:iron(III) transport system substrate-binding protein